ncbi:MAG: hypothetical protein HFJ38_02595 [Bacilli bacterium]|nr:hypothetical protein [Bacilli bacterium]
MNSREEINKEIHQEIEQEEKENKRKKTTIFIFKIILYIIIVFSLFYIYTIYISTNGLLFKEKRIITKKIPNSFDSLKIIHFSDLHFGSTIDINDLKKIIININERTPDLIIFTGDLIEEEYTISDEEIEELIKTLKKLSANIGMYAINGDEDDDNFTTIMKQCGFTVLDNNSDLIYKDSNTPILITGISSIKKGQNIEKAFNTYLQNNSLYHIVLMHEGDTFKELEGKYNIDLILAGNSLNGQICLTKDICFIRRENSYTYFKEYYQLGNTEMFISSGIGSDAIGFRFGARPSINFFRFSTPNK